MKATKQDANTTQKAKATVEAIVSPGRGVSMIVMLRLDGYRLTGYLGVAGHWEEC